MRSCCVPFALALLVLPFAAQSRKLNLPLPERPQSNGGAVFRLTADSRRVVYLAQQEGDERAELRSILADGSGPAQLLSHGVPVEEELDHEFFLSPSGAWVVFTTRLPFPLGPDEGVWRARYYVTRADGSSRAKPLLEVLGSGGELRFSPDERWFVLSRVANHELPSSELWSIPTDGRRDPIRLVELHGDLGEVRITTGERVVFEEARDGVVELISMTLAGTGRVRLNGALVAGGDVEQFALSADGTRAVYRADQRTNNVFELFSVPVDGSAAPVLLNGPLVAGGTVGSFDLSPDSRRVAYLATQDSERVRELYSVPIDGSAAPVKLNGTLRNPQGVEPGARFTPDSTRVVFRADALERDRFQLFSAPSDGSAPPVLLSGPAAVGGDVADVWSDSKPHLFVAGDRIVFLGDLQQGGVDELFSAPLDGSAPRTLLSGPMVTGGDVRQDFTVSADGSTVVFSADRVTDQAFELWSVAVAGGVPKKLTLASLRPDQGISYALASDGRQAYFVAARDGVNSELLRIATLEPGPAEPLAGPLGPHRRGSVQTFFELPGTERLVYVADQDVVDEPRLVSVRVDGAPEHIRLTDPVAGRYALSVRSWGSERIVYALETDTRAGLYSVPSDRRSEPVELTAAFVDPWFHPHVVPTSDHQQLLFLGSDSGSPLELFVVPFDGSAPPRKLSGTLVSGGEVVRYSSTLTPDDSTAVYLAEAETSDVVELFSVPLDGSAVPTRLSGTLVAGGDVAMDGSFGPRVSSDGSCVVYRADARTDEQLELFVVPIDGSAAPRPLSGVLPSAGDVQTFFALTPDARRVLYRADARFDERFELFSVPLDGSAAPARLGPELAPEGDVHRFELSPDGSLALLLVDVEGDGRSELYASPVTPGRGLQKLGLPAGSHAFSSTLTVASGYALCLAEVAGEGSTALFALPLDGRPGLRLDQATQRGAAGQWFQVSPDGTTVAYLSDAEIDGVDELFAVPVDGSRRAVRQHEPLQRGQAVHAFQISADSRRVFYLANQDDRSASELFEAFLKPPHAPRRF